MENILFIINVVHWVSDFNDLRCKKKKAYVIKLPKQRGAYLCITTTKLNVCSI